MATINLDAAYEQTAVILGTESLIMGATLLILAFTLNCGKAYCKRGIIFLAAAMCVLSMINFAEYIIDDRNQENGSLAITVFAASIEMFLLFFAYMSMLDKEFVNRRRLCMEVGLIAICTAPALLFLQDNQSVLSKVLFGVGMGYYAVKLLLNIRTYIRQIKKTTEELENYHSQEGRSLLRWVNNTFFMVLSIGIVSLVVPMTNLLILTIYNASLFFAYFYIYSSVIRNIDLFDRSMEAIESPEGEIPQVDLCARKRDGVMASHQKFLEDWIGEKGFCTSGITASEVASQLHTNRTKLSKYLKDELHTNYYEWIAGLRIEEAKKQLIEDPDKSIIDIAHDVGIEDRYNFGRVFQRFAGMSPTAYRKEYFKKIV